MCSQLWNSNGQIYKLQFQLRIRQRQKINENKIKELLCLPSHYPIQNIKITAYVETMSYIVNKAAAATNAAMLFQSI